MSDADDFASEFARMIAAEARQDGEEPVEPPAPTPESDVDPVPIERAVLRALDAKRARQCNLVDLVHPPEEAA